MKHIFTLYLLLFSFSCLYAQTLYTRKDSITIKSDTVTLKTGSLHGVIQWQHSLDGKEWSNLLGKTDTLLNVAKTNEGYYRARIADGNCLPIYSDTAAIVINKTVNEQITSPDEIAGATYIDRDDAIFTYIVPQGIASIPLNTVLVSNAYESDIRVVTATSQNGDTLSVTTVPGSMEDLFINQEFKLTTELLNNTNKSAYLTKSALAKAMVDNDGYIHPVRVINNIPGNLKSTQTTDDGSAPTINFNYDFSGTPIWNKDGSEISISEGYFKLGAKLNYEFKFESSSFDWNEKKFPKGKLTHFKISTDKEVTKAEAKVVLTAKTSGKFEEEDTKTLKEKVFTKTFEYLIIVPPAEPIPFWVTVSVDLMRDASATISGEVSASVGATAGVNLELGASYDNGKWSAISPKATPSLILEGPSRDANVNIQAKYEVYPHIDVAFYSTLAPYLEIGPYMREELECSAAGNYKYDFCSGADARLGVRAEIFGIDLFDFKTDDLNLYEDTLYTAPKKVQLISGGNQKGTAGKPLPQPVIVKVLDSKGNPLKNTLVHFKASMGKLFNSLPLSLENAELKSAMLYASAIDNTQLTAASDSTGQVSINWIIADTTAKQKIETYLMNGKNSIIEESRDTISAETCGCDESKFGSFTDSRDGHVYKTIKIGNQTWMAENLAYLPYTTSTSTWSNTAPCYYIINYAAYGVLYNWPAAMSSCPTGWHLPSDAEWTSLSDFLGGDAVAGGKMKSTTGWASPNTGATNESCFSALSGGGYLHSYLGNYMLGSNYWNGYWWCSSEGDVSKAWSIGMSDVKSSLYRNCSFKESGFSVRCVKN
jgi:uncharacterized protein (TIGR02145 family)